MVVLGTVSTKNDGRGAQYMGRAATSNDSRSLHTQTPAKVRHAHECIYLCMSSASVIVVVD